MAEPKKQNYLHGAAILAAGVVIMKILGFIYKVPLGNILGDEGYTHFLVAYNIYSVFLTVATAGLPVALSRMISEADTLDRPAEHPGALPGGAAGLPDQRLPRLLPGP